MKISIEKLEKAKAAVGKVYDTTTAFKADRVEDYTMAVLNAIEVEVEEPPEPPVMPEGLSEGTWTPCCGHDAEKGKYYIHANNVKIAEVYSSGDRTFMAGSKKLAEKVIAMFETWSPGGHGPEALGMLDALDGMGCNVDKFREAK